MNALATGRVNAAFTAICGGGQKSHCAGSPIAVQPLAQGLRDRPKNLGNQALGILSQRRTDARRGRQSSNVSLSTTTNAAPSSLPLAYRAGTRHRKPKVPTIRRASPTACLSFPKPHENNGLQRKSAESHLTNTQNCTINGVAGEVFLLYFCVHDRPDQRARSIAAGRMFNRPLGFSNYAVS